MAGENNKVVIVTGGSSGIGRCTASALKENGCIVYEFSRRNIPMEGVTHLSVDVTNEDAVNAAVQQVIQKETKIDAVINCAGFGISGAVEFTSLEQAKAQFDVNFFGTVNVNKAVLPFLRRQGKGHIVNISSVAAVAHIPFQTFYSASKASAHVECDHALVLVPDADGRFQLSSSSLKDRTITVFYMGYRKKTIPVLDRKSVV